MKLNELEVGDTFTKMSSKTKRYVYLGRDEIYPRRLKYKNLDTSKEEYTVIDNQQIEPFGEGLE